MSMHTLMKKIALTALLATTPLLAQTPYDEGQKALREGHWTAAADQFSKAIETDESQADAAMYWRAHALYKAGRKGDAARQVRQLQARFPDSRWIREAQALQIEYETSTGEIIADDELRLFALSQLLDREPDRALPLVLDILQNTESDKTRQDALFLLGMSDLPAAQQVVAEAARNSDKPELQSHAINMLGMAGTAESLALLKDLYRESTDPRVKKAMIQAFAISDESEILGQLLATETDPELRVAIIQSLAVGGGQENGQSLVSLYPTASDREKRAVIEGMMIMDDAENLIALMKQEPDPALQREILQMLTVMDSDEADAYLFEMLETKP